MKGWAKGSLLGIVLATGCAATPAAPRTAQAAAPEPLPPPAPVLDTPADVPERFLVSTPKPALSLGIEARQVTLAQDGASRTFTVDSNELLFAGRHVMAHDAAGTLEVLVAEKLCQEPVSGEWVPYSARVTLDGGDFIFGCARDAPPR